MAEMKGEARSPEGGLLLWGSSTHITNRSVWKFPNVPRLRQELPTSADTQKLLPFLLSLFLCPTTAYLVWGQNTSEKILDSRVFYLQTLHSVAQVDKVFGNKPSPPNQKKTWYLLPGSQRLLNMVLETNKIQMLLSRCAARAPPCSFQALHSKDYAPVVLLIVALYLTHKVML